MDILDMLPYTGLAVIDIILVILYTAAVGILVLASLVAAVFIIGALVLYCYIWIPILGIIIIIMKLFGMWKKGVE